MYENEWIPQAILIGISWDDFWNFTPKKLHAYAKADSYRRRRADEDAWLSNMYTLYAVQVALDKGFNGKKSKLEYPTKPFSEDQAISTNAKIGDKTVIDEEHPENTVLSKEDQKKVNYLFASLGIMKANWEIENNMKKQADSVS